MHIISPSNIKPVDDAGVAASIVKLSKFLKFKRKFIRLLISGSFGNTMLYINFQYGWELVLIQRIYIGFEAILEKYFKNYKNLYETIYDDSVSSFANNNALLF